MYPYPDNKATLKSLMRDLPMSAEIHATVLRNRVQARRMIEDAREAAVARARSSSISIETKQK